MALAKDKVDHYCIWDPEHSSQDSFGKVGVDSGQNCGTHTGGPWLRKTLVSALSAPKYGGVGNPRSGQGRAGLQ